MKYICAYDRKYNTHERTSIPEHYEFAPLKCSLANGAASYCYNTLRKNTRLSLPV